MKKAFAIMLILTMLLTMADFNINSLTVQAENKKENDEMFVQNVGETLGNKNGFLLADGQAQAKVYIDTANEEISAGGGHEYCGLEIIADTFAEDVGLVTGQQAQVVTDASEMSENVIIAGTIGGNRVIDTLISRGSIDVSGLYRDGELKWDCYQMQFVSGDVLASCGYGSINNALVITGSNKRGAMYGLFNISEHIGVSAWVYMADAVPVKYSEVYLDDALLEFNKPDMYLAKEPSVKYRGFFINDESPSFTGWAHTAFGGVNENCYKHIFELLIRMKANYLWPAMWGNSFSDEGKEFKLANAVFADAYGICMGTSHHEACCRAGVEWQRVYRNYGSSNAWDYDKNSDAIYKFWEDGIKRNGNFENTITMGMRGEGDSALGGTVQQNIDRLKTIISDQNGIINNYIEDNPDSKTKDAFKIYIPYSENEEFFYGPDDGSIDGLNKWEGMDDITIMLTDDNYGNIRSLPEESVRYRDAGWGLYYHLDGHVGTGAYEWVSSTQLEHIWDQLTMAYDYNVRNIWVINVGDIKPLEMELNYALDIAYDMEKWGQPNTAETYRKEWLKKQLGGINNCPDDIAAGVADCVADFLKISTYRKAEYVKPELYSNVNYNEAQEVLDLCLKTIDEADYYYNNYFKGTEWDDAYYQLVYYQAVATANVTRMMIFKSLNNFYSAHNSSLANIYAEMVDECVDYDKELTDYYNNTMSDKKWKNMMSSPHVGFVSWDSSGWSYPKGSTINIPDEAKMLVSVDGDASVYEKGTVELPLFTNTMKQRYCITMENGGKNEYSFTVGTLSEWIKITDKDGNRIINGGTVKNAAYFYISVDWTKVRSDKTGTVVIKGNGETVKLIVNTKYTEYKSKGVRTHFGNNGTITIDAEEVSRNISSAGGITWNVINGYGRYRSAMKMFPVTESFMKKTGNTHTVKIGNNIRIVTEYEEPLEAPYMEYRIYVEEEGDYTFTAYTTTTNNIFKPSDWGYVPVELFYGIQVDDNYIQNINSLPDGKYISYAADGDNRWKDGIMNNIHISESAEHMTEGIHTIRVYGIHAGLGLERLVISNEKLKDSYLGPQKTFMLDYDIIPEQKKGVHYEAAAGSLNYGEPSDITAITDAGDVNDPADPVEIETPIPRPVPPVDADNNKNDGSNGEIQPVQNEVSTIENGKVYTYKKYKYRVKGRSVVLVSPVKKNIKKATVPAKIIINKKTFNVTGIEENAFKNCKKLKSAVIGSNIKKIGARAFYGCRKLKKITIKSKVLRKAGKNAFKKIGADAVIKVPKSKKKAYKKILGDMRTKITN